MGFGVFFNNSLDCRIVGFVVLCLLFEFVVFYLGVGILGEEVEDRGSGKMNFLGVLSLEVV